ncbi:MAG: B12-binding domain-containing radical SAM protein [Myxococcaceae bacterium]
MRVLLSSVFKPYAVDDSFGRKENVMELFHNQVTREQGIFSLRMNHPSSGLHLIAENLESPAMVLDFPSLAEFEREVAKGYDVVGLSFIVPNFKKAQHMAKRVRELSPKTRIVLGGHGTTVPGLEELIEYDAICRGDGVAFMREYLNENVGQPIKHPRLYSAFNRHFLGAPVGGTSAMVLPGNGCPNACDFCCTTHFFQKKYTAFLETGKQMYDVCCDLERNLGATEFFVLDENFLKYRERALELLDLMEKNGKQWSFGLFSSAESIAQYGLDTLSRMGIFFLWIGVESKRHVYAKNKGADMKALIQSLRSRGACVLASGILFLDHHTKENIDEDIDYLVGLEADFVQFMQLGPLPGTALYQRVEGAGKLRHDVPFEEWHGQKQIWFDHPNFTAEETEEVLKGAFRRDYLANGPSLLRMFETYLRGYHTLRAATEPYLVGRRELLAKRLEEHRPSLAVLARRSPTQEARARAMRAEAEVRTILGPMNAAALARTAAVQATALAETVRLATVGSARQPQTQWTPYRLQPVSLATRLRSRAELTMATQADRARAALAPGVAAARWMLRGAVEAP